VEEEVLVSLDDFIEVVFVQRLLAWSVLLP
jgi:hypothetical protein